MFQSLRSSLLFECYLLNKVLAILSVYFIHFIHLFCLQHRILAAVERRKTRKVGKQKGCVCECVCTHFCVHAMTAVFCSESDPVNSSANFSIYPLLCVYKSALSHPIHQFPAFHLFNMPPFFYHILSIFQILLEPVEPLAPTALC